MIIPSRQILSYLDSLTFPVIVLAERGDQIESVEDRDGLLALVALEAVIGVGSWNRIKRFRMNIPQSQLHERREAMGNTASPSSGTLSSLLGTRYSFPEQVRTARGPRKVWAFKHLGKREAATLAIPRTSCTVIRSLPVSAN